MILACCCLPCPALHMRLLPRGELAQPRSRVLQHHELGITLTLFTCIGAVDIAHLINIVYKPLDSSLGCWRHSSTKEANNKGRESKEMKNKMRSFEE